MGQARAIRHPEPVRGRRVRALRSRVSAKGAVELQAACPRGAGAGQPGCAERTERAGSAAKPARTRDRGVARLIEKYLRGVYEIPLEELFCRAE